MELFIINYKFQISIIIYQMLALFGSSVAEIMGQKDKKVVCFYVSRSSQEPEVEKFSTKDLDPDICTHLIYAYAALSDDDILARNDSEKGAFLKFNSIKSNKRNVQTILAVGKGHSHQLSAIAADKERRIKFARNALIFLRINHFNGINLSWQQPGSRQGRPDDKVNYVLLVQALREEFERESSKTGKPSLLISIDVPHSTKVLRDGFDLYSLSKYLDFMNMFTFNYRNVVETVPHHAPLFSAISQTGEIESQFSADSTVKYFLNLGVQREKLILGIPTFGHSYYFFETEPFGDEDEYGLDMENYLGKREAFLPYHQICNMIKSEEWKLSNHSGSPVARKNKLLINYDDEDSVRHKAHYAVKMGLGGIMFWTLDKDDFNGECGGKRFPLVKAGQDTLLQPTVLPAATISSYNEEGKPLFSFTSPNKAFVASSKKTDDLIQDETRTIKHTDHKINSDFMRPFLESKDFTQDSFQDSRRAAIERKFILEQLISLIKKTGLQTLESLVDDASRSYSLPSNSNKKIYKTDNYGPAVTEFTVTSPPLILRKAAPIVLSNFTININELNVDPNSLRGK